MSNRPRRKGGRVTARPVGQQGVSIDREGEIVRVAIHDFRTAFTVEWSIRDAREVCRLLGEAIDEPTKTSELVRDTGLVVTNRMPG